MPVGGEQAAPYFVTGIENFTVKVEHSFVAKQFYDASHDSIYTGTSSTSV